MASEQEWFHHGLDEELVLEEKEINASIPVEITSAVYLTETEASPGERRYSNLSIEYQ